MSSSWHTDALAVIAALASSGHAFDTRDVQSLDLPAPPNPRNWGAALSAASRSGLIFPHGERRIPGHRHQHAVTVWAGHPVPSRPVTPGAPHDL